MDDDADLSWLAMDDDTVFSWLATVCLNFAEEQGKQSVAIVNV